MNKKFNFENWNPCEMYGRFKALQGYVDTCNSLDEDLILTIIGFSPCAGDEDPVVELEKVRERLSGAESGYRIRVKMCEDKDKEIAELKETVSALTRQQMESATEKSINVAPGSDSETVKDYIEPPENIKNKNGGRPRSDADWNKAQALRNAGWSLDAVSKELGCSAQTVANHTHKPEPEEITGKNKELEGF